MVMRPSRGLPPVELWRGVKPRKAANSRPLAKSPMSWIVAVIAEAVTGPTPGTGRSPPETQTGLRLWASGMLERKTVKYKFKLTAVALANKVARIVFVLMTRGGQYDDRPVAA